MVPWGTYTITTPDVVPMSNGTRAKFVMWSGNSTESSRLVPVGNNLTLHAIYGIQHLLNVSSPYGSANGSGWYFQNTFANVSVGPTSIPVEGQAAWLGERYVFDHWTGACTSSEHTCTLLMNGPKNTQAVWRPDWTITATGGLLLVGLAALLAVFRLRRITITRRKRVRRVHRSRTRAK